MNVVQTSFKTKRKQQIVTMSVVSTPYSLLIHTVHNKIICWSFTSSVFIRSLLPTFSEHMAGNFKTRVSSICKSMYYAVLCINCCWLSYFLVSYDDDDYCSSSSHYYFVSIVRMCPMLLHPHHRPSSPSPLLRRHDVIVRNCHPHQLIEPSSVVVP